MQLNADFARRVVVHSAQQDWVASPMAGVDRRMLDRLGDEVARATTIVRYAPGSAFSPHIHTGGEEFLVLDGVFQDEHGDYPAGTYVRNPPTSQHRPGSAPGCTIFVKLWQFDLADRTAVRVTLGDALQQTAPGRQDQLLHEDPREQVSYHVWDAGAQDRWVENGGAEVLVLAGALIVDGALLLAGSWMRLPDREPAQVVAGDQGAKFWRKSGHLSHAKAPIGTPA